jgi:hypothetical protein
MQGFRFVLNNSFMSYPSHPITIPRSQVSYKALENELGQVREGRLRFPDGSSVGVRLNHSVAGFGEYYQLRTQGHCGWLGTSARVGHPVTIVIGRRGHALEVVVRDN